MSDTLTPYVVPPNPAPMIMREVFVMPGPDGEPVRVRRTTTTTVTYAVVREDRNSAERVAVTGAQAHALAQHAAEHGPLTRDQAASFIRQAIDPDATDAQISNVLTRTRRRGLIVNTGTRAHPAWHATSHPFTRR